MTSFGEIVEPGSRNAWEDWDDTNASEANPELKWQKDVKDPGKFGTFLILEGKYLADSVKMQAEFKMDLVNSIPEVNLHLYNTETFDSYVCVIKDYDILLSSEIIELMKIYLTQCQDVIAIVTKPLVEYQVQEISNKSFVLRTLSTKKLISKSLHIDYPRLEQPNILSGVSAGAISLRECLELSGAVVICYMEHPDEYRINELQQLLDQLNIVPLKSKSNNVLQSNLYI